MNKKEILPPLPNVTGLLLDAVCLVDASGRFVFASAACERIFGYTQEEIVGKHMYDLILPADREKTRSAASDVLAGQYKTSFENRYVRKDGSIVDVMWSARWSESDQLRVAVARDITERKSAERIKQALYAISEVAHSTEDLALLFEKVHGVINEHVPAPNFVIALCDEEGACDENSKDGEKRNEQKLSYVHREQNRASVPLKPDTLVAEVVRTGQAVFLTPETAATKNIQGWTEIGEGARYCFAIPLKAPSQTLGAIVMLSYCESDHYTERDLEFLQLIAERIATILDRNKMQARFRYMAEYDQLTGLPNRVLLHDRLKTALERARRQEQKLALLFIDLDKFKQVNDNFGHLAGDYLLQVVATRLKTAIRESDTVARIGGDEFAVLLEGAQTQAQANKVIEKILTTLNQPLTYDGHEVNVLASIGVAFYPEHGENERELINHADRAMYATKR